jgi:hypothetical protein
MAYASASDVAGLARTWTENGEFLDPDAYTSGTNPTLAQVDAWLEQISVMMDLALANHGFAVPVTEELVITVLGAKVAAFTADMVHLAHSKGRLFSDRIQESGQDPMSIIDKDVNNWVQRNVVGLEAMGVPRLVNESDQTAFSVAMTRNGAGSSTEEYARPRFLIRRP